MLDRLYVVHLSCHALSSGPVHPVHNRTGHAVGVPVPTIKIASNSDLARRKPRWIYFDAGACLEPGCSMEEKADALMNLTLAVAFGAQTRNELNSNREIAFWKRGVTL